MRTLCNINVIFNKCRIKQRKTTSFFGKGNKNIKVLQMQLYLFSLYNIIQVTKETGEEMVMKIIKRDGTIVDYNSEKIKIAISKANLEVEEEERASDEEIEKIIKYIEKLKKPRILV